MDIAYRFRLGLVMAIVLACPLFAQADGVKFPEVAFAKMPEIPQQRAMIVWQDGVETLVVETSYKSESPDVGWVLPIPAKPTKLDIADAGMLTSLSICLQPRITHDLSIFPKIPLFLIVCFLPLACVAIFVKERDQRIKWALAIVFVIVFCVLVAISGWESISTQSTTAEGGLEIKGITQLSQQRLGNYDVAVLKADDSDALSQWLKSNSLMPLDAKGKNVVDDYISRKWCFVVARLHRESGGLAAAHPIAVTFPTTSPVYPMKMTSLAGSDTHVELFIISDRSAAADGFQCVASDSYQQTIFKKSYYDVATGYISESKGFTIGSPAAGEFMWPGCVVTKLTADLSPRQMDHDIAINLTDFSPYQQHLYSVLARWDIVLSIGLWGALAVILALAAAFNKMRKPRRWELPAIAGLAGLALVALVVVHTTLPVIPVGFDREHGRFFRYMHTDNLLDAAEHLAKEGSLHSGMTPAKFAAFPTLLAKSEYYSHTNITNPFSGEKIRYERSPGNFSSRKIGDKTFFCIYDQDGAEKRIELPDKQPDE